MATNLLADGKHILKTNPDTAVRWAKNRVLKKQITREELLAWPIWSKGQKSALAQMLATAQHQRAGEKEPQPQRPRIYADACYKRGLIGLAVVGDGWQVAIQGMVDTNNEAECLAILLACKEAKNRQIASPIILSDSQLAVFWTNGSYAQRSETAYQYTSRIRQALAEIGASLQWIPGKDNRADGPSRAVVQKALATRKERRNQSVESFDGTPFEKVKSLPLGKLRHEDFAAIKSGRDEFSAMQKPKLIEAVEAQDYENICQALDKEKYQLSALRWMLRGLSVDKAIRKVEVDREIGHEVAERREVARMRWDDDGDE